MSLYLIKPIRRVVTPDPYSIFIDRAMEDNSRCINFAESEGRRSVRLYHNEDEGTWFYDFNWVIKLKRKECSQI